MTLKVLTGIQEVSVCMVGETGTINHEGTNKDYPMKYVQARIYILLE